MKKMTVMKVAAVLLSIAMLGGCGLKGNETATTAESQVIESDSTEPTTAEQTTETEATEQKNVTILMAAAASLKYAFDEELIQMFEAQYPWIKVESTYDSSGKLQAQIEEGLEADIFMSAAVKQMDALVGQDIVVKDSVVDLLENKIVLIVPADAEQKVTGFEDITNADSIAIGDPESVPAGQYAKEVLTSLGIWEAVEAKTSKGTNVTEVLNWVAEESADVGIVYATDAAATEQVKVLAEAPEGTLAKKIIYPVGFVASSEKQEAAKLFMEFLQTKEAIAVFESYGFSAVE